MLPHFLLISMGIHDCNSAADQFGQKAQFAQQQTFFLYEHFVFVLDNVAMVATLQFCFVKYSGCIIVISLQVCMSSVIDFWCYAFDEEDFLTN